MLCFKNEKQFINTSVIKVVVVIIASPHCGPLTISKPSEALESKSWPPHICSQHHNRSLSSYLCQPYFLALQGGKTQIWKNEKPWRNCGTT